VSLKKIAEANRRSPRKVASQETAGKSRKIHFQEVFYCESKQTDLQALRRQGEEAGVLSASLAAVSAPPAQQSTLPPLR